MGLFDRMGQVISSNFNALLDSAEDPKKSIELTLNEMRAQLRAARQEVVSSVAAEKQLRNKLGELDAEVKKWEGRAELAVKKGDDHLAKEALTHKRRIIEERDRAEALRAEQRGNALEMKRELERMDSKIEELSSRKGALIANAERAKAESSPTTSGSGGASFAEFRRMEAQSEGVEAAVQAQREIDEALSERGASGLSRDDLEARFRQLEGSSAAHSEESGGIDDELAQLKKKIRIGT
jgi:phage shock protein A